MEKKTLEQIEESKAASQKSFARLKQIAETKKAERAEATSSIKRRGLKLAYLDPISIAYAEGSKDKTTLITFTVRSRRDQFCRADARVALSKHLGVGTNTFELKAPVSLMKRSIDAFLEELDVGIAEFVEKNPTCVPNYFRKAARLIREEKRLRETIVQKREIIRFMEEVVDESDEYADEIRTKIDRLLCDEG